MALFSTYGGVVVSIACRVLCEMILLGVRVITEIGVTTSGYSRWCINEGTKDEKESCDPFSMRHLLQ